MDTGWLGPIAVLLMLPVTGGGDGRGAPLPARAARRETAGDPDKGQGKGHGNLIATEQYYANNDQFPPSLDALTLPQPNGGAPFLKPHRHRGPLGQTLPVQPARHPQRRKPA